MDNILSSMGSLFDKKEPSNSPTQIPPSQSHKQKAGIASPPESNESLTSKQEKITQSKNENNTGSHKMKPQTNPPLPTHSSPNSLSSLTQDDNRPSAVIGSKITFKGELSGDEDLLIQGVVEGTVSLKGNQLTVGKLGKVKANLSAKNIIVDGNVEGDLMAEDHIAINASSIVKGNIIADRVTLEDGAKFRGSIDMNTDTPAPQSPANAE